MLGTIIVFSLAGGVLGIAGGALLLTREHMARRLSLYFVAFATGTLLANSFLHFLPEALEELSAETVMPIVLAGFLLFLILEKLLIWYHCHDGTCDVHDPSTFKYTVIIGDTFHNFLDGIAIAVSFLIDFNLGLATTLAIFAHEIPQEIGDFGVLLHAGMTRGKVFLVNVMSALATTVGAVLGFYLSDSIESIEPFVLAFLAGNFIYVGASDLIPHLKREVGWRASFFQIFLMLAGVMTVILIRGGH